MSSRQSDYSRNQYDSPRQKLLENELQANFNDRRWYHIFLEILWITVFNNRAVTYASKYWPFGGEHDFWSNVSIRWWWIAMKLCQSFLLFSTIQPQAIPHLTLTKSTFFPFFTQFINHSKNHKLVLSALIIFSLTMQAAWIRWFGSIAFKFINLKVSTNG